jgi:sugar lactone lactonase YvrE
MFLLGVVWLLWATSQSAGQTYYWTTFVGRVGETNGGDGVGTNAFFNQPTGGATDAAGNFYVADEYNNAIRKVAPDGTVTTFAGKLGVAGTNDGTGGAARFTQPTNLTFDKNGNMYVVDTYAHTIRKITPGGSVSTLAGLGNAPGSNDGTGSGARFNQPNGIGYDPGANVLYVADGLNGAIRRVTLGGTVTTIAGGGTGPGELFYGVEQVAVSSSGLLYVCDAWNSTIWTMDTNGGNQSVLAGPGAGHTWPAGSGSADGTGSAAQFSFPESLWLDSVGNAFVADYNNSTIRKVTPPVW